MKVKTYGFLSPVHKKTFEKIRTLQTCMMILLMNPLISGKNDKEIEAVEKSAIKKCRFCGGKLILTDTINIGGRDPPSCFLLSN